MRSRKALAEIFSSFSAVHNLSTEYAWLSASDVAFPPPYAQVVHKLPGVIRRVPHGDSCRRIRFRLRGHDTMNSLVISGSLKAGYGDSGRPAAVGLAGEPHAIRAISSSRPTGTIPYPGGQNPFYLSRVRP